MLTLFTNPLRYSVPAINSIFNFRVRFRKGKKMIKNKKIYFVRINKTKPVNYMFNKWIDCIKFVKLIYSIIENKKTIIEITELTEIKDKNENREKYISKTSTLKIEIEKIQELNKLPF